jgi:hypothetical protein
MVTMVAALPYIVFAMFFFLVAVIVVALVFSQRDENAVTVRGEIIEEITCGTQSIPGTAVRHLVLPTRKDPLWRIYYQDGRQMLSTLPTALILKAGVHPEDIPESSHTPPLELKHGRRIDTDRD